MAWHISLIVLKKLLYLFLLKGMLNKHTHILAAVYILTCRDTSEGFNKEVSVESHPVHQLTHPLHSADAKVVLPEGDVTQGSLPHVLAKTSWNVRGLVTKRTYFEVSDLLSCRYYPSAEVMLMLLFQELMLEEIRYVLPMCLHVYL